MGDVCEAVDAIEEGGRPHDFLVVAVVQAALRSQRDLPLHLLPIPPGSRQLLSQSEGERETLMLVNQRWFSWRVLM